LNFNCEVVDYTGCSSTYINVLAVTERVTVVSLLSVMTPCDSLKEWIQKS